jgi:hypothetical protein
MRVYVMTCDKYMATLQPFAYMFNKYWDASQEVIVAGFTPPGFPLPPNFSFISLGRDEDYPIGRWSDQLLALLDRIPDETFVLLFEDYLPIKPVNTDMVLRLHEFSMHIENLLKIDLCADRQFAGGVEDWADWDDVEFVKSDPNSAYHMSLYPGIWRKDLLYKVIIPNETPWDVEITGTNRLALFGDELLVLGTKQRPLTITLYHRSGDPSVALTDEISPEDIQTFKERGWL